MKMPEKIFVNAVNLRLIIKEEDDEERLLEILKGLVPLDLEKERIGLKRTSGKCLNLAPITVCELELAKRRHLRAFLDHLFERLSSEQMELLISQKESRLDGGCFFFVRLDKKRLLEGEYWITGSGDCFHIRMSMAAYPSNRKNGLRVLQEMLDEFLAKKV